MKKQFMRNNDQCKIHFDKIIKEKDDRIEELERESKVEKKRIEVLEVVEKRFAPLSLNEYLQVFHKNSLKVSVELDKSKVTRGEVSDPQDRWYPKKFHKTSLTLPAGGFDIWKVLGPSYLESFTTKSAPELKMLFQPVELISSEAQLVTFTRNTVNYPVVELIRNFVDSGMMKKNLGFSGVFRMQEHTNLGSDYKKENSELISGGKAEQADDFCIFKRDDNTEKIILCAVYKAPHKLPLDVIKRGLCGDNRTSEDVINSEDQGPDFEAKKTITKVLVQLFSSMMKKRVTRGCIFTGEAVVFLWVDEDPNFPHYRLFVPKENNDPIDPKLTAVGQILAFTLETVETGIKDKSQTSATRSLLSEFKFDFITLIWRL